MRKSLLAALLLLLGVVECLSQGRQPVCTNGQLGPETLSMGAPGAGFRNPKYGFYCGKDNRCPGGKAGCPACDAVDEVCKSHDVCWEQGVCAGPKPCDQDEYFDLNGRDSLPEMIGRLTAAEKARLAQMRACNAALCNGMRAITAGTADANEARGMPQLVYGCHPPLLPVLGGTWKMSNGTLVPLSQTADKVYGSYSGGPGHTGLTGTISGTFHSTGADKGEFVGDYFNREGAVSGHGSLKLKFSTTYKNGPNKIWAQDKLEGEWVSETFAGQKGPWLMVRD